MPVFRAVLWQALGTVADLDKKVDLGNSGTILGSGYFADFSASADVGYLMVPIR